MLKITSAASSNIGKIKSVNGDNFYLNEFFLTEVTVANGAVYRDDATRRVQYYAVFDGFDEDVRSELNYNVQFADGSAASRIAAEELLNLQRFVKKSKEYNLDRLVNIYAAKTNRIMNAYTKDKKVRIGASFALLCVDAGTIRAYNAGNVKIFMLRDNRLVTLTTDDTKVEAYVSSGKIASGSADDNPEGSVLVQHLGNGGEGLNIHTAKMERIKSGDKFLICTDSIFRYISKQKLHNFMTLDISDQEILNEIMTEASRQGGDDNYTAVIIEVSSAEKSKVNNSGGAVRGFIPLIFKKPVRIKPAHLKAAAWIAVCCLVCVLAIFLVINGPLKNLLGNGEETDSSENISGNLQTDTEPSMTNGADLTNPTEPTADTGGEPTSASNNTTASGTVVEQQNVTPENENPPTTTMTPTTARTAAPPPPTTAAPTTTSAPTTTAAPVVTTAAPPPTTTAPTVAAPETTVGAEPETTTATPVTEPPPTEPVAGEEETVGAWTD